MMLAKPKKLKKPTTSVTVVRITVLPMAGSTSNLFNKRGIKEPKRPAQSRLTIIDSAMTTPSIPLSNHKDAIIPMIIAKKIPFANESKTSLRIVLNASCLAMSPNAS